MRPAIILLICLLSACATPPKTETSSEDNCLTGEKGHWEFLKQPPVDANRLRMMAESSNANPSQKFEDRWYQSNDELLYCRREDWCVSEAWKFARHGEDWALIDHNFWVCVTRNQSSPNPDLVTARG